MSFVKTPVKGMRDCLPADMRLREQVIADIKETYGRYGFALIETPAIEHIENLTSKQGGENEKLIFKILKRGRDLDKALEKNLELSDIGLRYDLTVPLARYYAANAEYLPTPFKALQIGSVWRADKPQKGRFRQFTQCDIDILGENTILAEIELVGATSNMLSKILERIGISKFTVHISDRRILKAMAAWAGFEEKDFDEIFILLDKLDKIGMDGVRAEMEKAAYPAACIEKYMTLLAGMGDVVDVESFCAPLTGGHLDAKVVENLVTIISCVRTMVGADVNIAFDPSLVRGMGYYTGTIFEVTLDGYGFAIGGGGRYDKMIGKFSGTEVAACGFSIGFERIITILQDHLSAEALNGGEKHAILLDAAVSPAVMTEVFARAREMRQAGTTVTVQTLKKNAKNQIDRLEADGYTKIEKIYAK